MESNDQLAEMIASKVDLVDHEITEYLIGIFCYLPDEIVLEIVRCSQSVLAGRLDPNNCGTMEGFVSTHRKVLGLFLESLDD